MQREHLLAHAPGPKVALIVLLAALFATFGGSAAHSAEPMPPQDREYIYGAELMTPQERDAYRAGLQQRKDAEGKGQYRQQHRQRLQTRAREKKVELDDKGVVQRQEGER